MALILIGLLILDIPLFLFIAWLAFDSAHQASQTIWDTVVSVLKLIFIPWYVRILLGMETDGALGILQIGGFFIACGAIFYGELWLINWYFPGTFPLN